MPPLSRRQMIAAALTTLGAAITSPAFGQIYYQRIPSQYIAALTDPAATSGTGAETWGHWRHDPGPIGVPLQNFEALQTAGNVGPGGWQFDTDDWWLDENGILMKAPRFPMPSGQFYVTNGAGSYSLLTVEDADADGAKAWSLSRDQTIADVTHGPCRAGRYTPTAGAGSCTPARVAQGQFPLPLGAEPPAVENCAMVEYEVLIIFGIPVEG